MTKKNDTWFVYIVECADGSYYTGISNDVEKRMRAHNSGSGAKYTKFRRPVSLVYSEQYVDRSTAAKREYKLKQLTLKKKKELIAMGAMVYFE